jgi:hypothetical protein
MNTNTDNFGRRWPIEYQVCPTCGQPDNVGDCDHTELTLEQALQLGAYPETVRP